MNCPSAAKHDRLRANPKWRPKASIFANCAIDHLPGPYVKTIVLLMGIPINVQAVSRKTPVKCIPH